MGAGNHPYCVVSQMVLNTVSARSGRRRQPGTRERSTGSGARLPEFKSHLIALWPAEDLGS